MQLLEHVDPRGVALLLVPVLLAAGAAQSPAPAPPVVAVRAPAPAGPAPLQLQAAPDPGPAAAARPGQAARETFPVARHRDVGASATSLSVSLTPAQRGRAALRALAYEPATLGYRLRFVPYRGGSLGTTNRPERLITVYVRPGQAELELRTTIAHEIGHAFDFTYGTPARRDAYRRLRGLPAGAWFPCNRCSDFASPAGDFAEVFAVWLAGPGDFRSRLAGPPTPAQLGELAPLFRPPAAARPAAPSPAPSPTPTQDRPSKLPALPDPRPTTAPERP